MHRHIPDCIELIIIIISICLFIGSVFMLVFGIYNYTNGSYVCPENTNWIGYRTSVCIYQNNTITQPIHISPNYTTDIVLISVGSIILFGCISILTKCFIIDICCRCKNGKCFAI